ncbi:DUF1326 domain-containing protein [Cupriavidus sp. 8B]
MAYDLEGQLLEVCTCKILCPCWVGEPPDGNGTCQSINSWHVDKGSIDGVDVSNLTIAGVNHIPGPVLEGDWKVIYFVDERATPAQHDAMVSVWTGKLGGPVKDLVSLYAAILAVEKAPILFQVTQGKGTLRIGNDFSAEMVPFQGATGGLTTLHDTAFSTIPGAPAYVSKALYYKATEPRLGIAVDLQGHNAIQGKFHFKG